MNDIGERIQNLLAKVNLDEKRIRIDVLQKESSDANFWQDHKEAAKKMKELSDLQKQVEELDLLKMYFEEEELAEAKKLLEKLETLIYFSSEYDSGNTILSIHAGQGGVEAMDWTEILFRMYSRFFEKNGWSYEIIDQTLGDEAGIKSITVSIDGAYSYGHLKHEAGVHRLVRQSPFNADNLRQTSFALVEVLPAIESDTQVDIKDADLDWEFYRASSHGGQNVQKVSSAVRLKHIPSGIVVTAQAERYQAQNREYALKILRAKLWFIQEEERKKHEQALKGGYKTPGWGNQIRSYVLHPYKMVKDLRTNCETSNTDSVLDGNIDNFIQAELRQLS